MPPDPERLFRQADALVASREASQTDLRRAVSSAYYGMFHFILTAAADMVVGPAGRSGARYSVIYRSVDHSRLRALCSQLTGSKPQNSPLLPSGGFGTIVEFARIAGTLYELRNLADYDPSREFFPDEVNASVAEAREAIAWFRAATKEQQETFLTLLLFRPR